MSIDKYTWDGQDAKVVEKVYNKIVDMLTSGESINYIALQKKPAVTLFPDSITVSNKRIFLCEFTKLGLATNFEIFSWYDIKDISFKEEIFGSKVTVIPFTGENLTIDYIPKVQARKLYQLIKESLEDTQRGKDSASIPKQHNAQERDTIAQEASIPAQPQFSVPKDDSPTPSAPVHVQPTEDIVAHTDDEVAKKLMRLKNLFDRQLISQAEYENKKAEILKEF